MKNWLQQDRFWQVLLMVYALLVYAAGLPVEIMEPDAAVYAEVSREMFASGNYLEIYLKGTDWLDKPHFPFWCTAWSFLLFGVNAIAYKLPAIFFVLLGALYTYRFGRRFYNRETGVLAALILLTAQHIITSNMDVRAEPYMTGLTIMALYHAAVYMDEKKMRHLLLTGVAMAALMMTKGLFTIIPIGAALGCSMLLKRQWKEIFHRQWLLMGFITLLCMSPMLYGYYVQFDLHPEKTIFGRQGVSGLKFFFIDSQWGRFVNKGPIKGNGDPFFFLHTLLWAFLPWALLAYYGLYRKLRMILKGDGSEEVYTFFGFVVMFLIFSASGFQLAHYLNGVFPLLAIVTAATIGKASPLALRHMGNIQVLQTAVLPAVPVLLLIYFHEGTLKADTMLVMAATIVLFLLLLKERMALPLAKIIYLPALMVLMINYYLHRDFYPQLLHYQAESVMAAFYKNAKLPVEQLVTLGEEERIVSVKLNHIVPELPMQHLQADEVKGKYVLTHKQGLHTLDSIGVGYLPVKTFENFEITMLTAKFLNKHTRKATLDSLYLIKTAHP